MKITFPLSKLVFLNLLWACALLPTTQAATAPLECPPNCSGTQHCSSSHIDAETIEKTAQSETRLQIDNRSIEVTATAGKLLVRTNDNEPMAEVFYVAYTQNGAKGEKRPVTFIWDGGPGGSTIGSHMLGIGPLRYSSQKQKRAVPPYTANPNEYSLLAFSDLVFIDPIGTGYSKAVGRFKDSDFWGFHEDGDVISKAIQRYLNINQRWSSPKFILGLSYGTSRASLVSNLLLADGVGLNGVVLVASALNFAAQSYGMDHAYLINIPTFAAVAWHHGKTAHQSKSLEELIDEVREFIREEYLKALFQGNTLSPSDRDQIASKLAGYIGLNTEYIKRANLRITVTRFRKELLRDQEVTIGRMDGRTLDVEYDHAGEEPESDYWVTRDYMVPGMSVLMNLLQNGLGYKTTEKYKAYNHDVAMGWKYTHDYPSTAGHSLKEILDRNVFPPNIWPAAELSAAMRTMPSMKVFQLHGYYDMATPFAWAEYDLSHAHFDERLKKNIKMAYYATGHGIYMDDDELPKIFEDFREFYQEALNGDKAE